ncbi:UNKNOWN [Stylonychia lemnae]|uniref:Uncharacterized protein n=1 Tax=Stylonychia lemnae TaxID=5949 RepID=A0A078B506_STYLE|nr:UNKNOWN [Stylonychia lemnae]|eukprot:CDW89610.1 UNKNOWN [Stylonychia lemnae]
MIMQYAIKTNGFAIIEFDIENQLQAISEQMKIDATRVYNPVLLPYDFDQSIDGEFYLAGNGLTFNDINNPDQRGSLIQSIGIIPRWMLKSDVSVQQIDQVSTCPTSALILFFTYTIFMVLKETQYSIFKVQIFSNDTATYFSIFLNDNTANYLLIYDAFIKTDKIYLFDSDVLSFPLEPFTLLDSQCSDVTIIYSFDTNDPGVKSMISFNLQSFIMSVQTSNYRLPGNHDIKLIGKIDSQTIQTIFQLTLISSEGANLVASTIPNIEYMTGNQLQVQQLPNFTTSTVYPIIYFLTTQDYQGYDQSFISFNNGTSNNTIVIFTNDMTKAGTYYMSIIGKFTRNAQTQQWSNFTIEIIDKCVYQITEFSKNMSDCGDFMYELNSGDFNGLVPIPIIFDQNLKEIVVQTQNQAMIKNYSVDLKGYYLNGYREASTNFQVQIKCNVESLFGQVPKSSYIYKHGQANSETVIINPFVQTPNCGYSVKYLAGILPDFVETSLDNLTYSIVIKPESVAGSYNIEITGNQEGGQTNSFSRCIKTLKYLNIFFSNQEQNLQIFKSQQKRDNQLNIIFQVTQNQFSLFRQILQTQLTKITMTGILQQKILLLRQFHLMVIMSENTNFKLLQTKLGGRPLLIAQIAMYLQEFKNYQNYLDQIQMNPIDTTIQSPILLSM